MLNKSISIGVLIMKIMNYLQSIVIFLITCNLVCSQSYSRLIDHGFDNQHIVQDIQVDSYSLVALMGHICNDLDDCFTINYFNQKNGELENIYLDTNKIDIGNFHALIVEKDRVVVSSHDDNNGFDKIMVNVISGESSEIETNIFLESDTIQYINDGILEHKGAYYIWGEGRDLNIDEPIGHIVKLDSSLTIVKDAWYYNRGTFRSHLNDLQVQPDGNMTFLIKSDGPPGSGSERTDSTHLIKIDTSGSIIKDITIEEGMDINRNFYTLRNGNYVIMNFRETIYGSVQCLDHETGDVVWDWELPKGNFNEFNRFSIRDYVETSNGDIVICGLVQEVLDDIWDDSRWTAIAARLSPEGELLWFRRFLVPNETNPEEKGPYHFDILTRVFEREDSTLCFLGESTQYNLTPPNMQYAWIMALDEDDCYKGNCSDTIVVDKRLTNKLKFELGAKWTYERAWNIANRVDFETFEITDTLTIDNMKCYVINNNTTFCTDDNKVLVPDNRLDGGYQLIYDFDELDSFKFQCYDRTQEIPLEYNVIIDSIKSESIADGSLLNFYYLSSICSSGPDSERIIEGIGSSIGQVISCIDICNDLGDPVAYELTKLRCFDNGTESYRFVDYACDSIWMTTSTEELMQEPFVLYPNPTNDVVYVEDGAYDLSYRLINIQGQVISQGDYTARGISLPYQGLFYITIMTDDGEWTKRVVRY